MYISWLAMGMGGVVIYGVDVNGVQCVVVYVCMVEYVIVLDGDVNSVVYVCASVHIVLLCYVL